MGELFQFAEDKKDKKELPEGYWKILIVDDDVSIHDVTISALKSVRIENYGLKFVSATSAKDAKKLLIEHNDIVLALVDVIMETPVAGLDLVNYIRNDLHNNKMRLIIRTGQPDEVPERKIIEQYDINDYKEKTEFTVDRLYTTIRSSIKQYIQLVELENKYEDVYGQMTTHPLTKLPNRQKLNELIDTDGPKHLVLINIDAFSMVNETQGFAIGDQLLMQMAAFLYSMYNDTMDVFHLEGDTFGLLCSDKFLSEDDILAIQRDINKMTFLLGGIENRLSVTMGFVMNEEGNLIQKAEFALKDARNLGRNRVSKYSEDIKIIKTIHHNSLWTQRVRAALEDKCILSYYQPIFSVKTNKVVKYESLMRLSYKGKIILPFEFLKSAKYSGQLYSAFKVMFENACRKTKEFDGQITINMTDKDLQEPDVIDFMDSIIKEYDVNTRQLGIEILEQKSIMNNEVIKKNIFLLADRGVSIFIDDFGAECSNFGQVINLPVSGLKIDGSFIKDLPENYKHQKIVESIVDFAQKMRIPTIAEFVHSQEVLDIVKKIGATYAQGFYLGEPLPDLLK